MMSMRGVQRVYVCTETKCWHLLHQCLVKHLPVSLFGDGEAVNDEGEIMVLDATEEEFRS